MAQSCHLSPSSFEPPRRRKRRQGPTDDCTSKFYKPQFRHRTSKDLLQAILCGGLTVGGTRLSRSGATSPLCRRLCRAGPQLQGAKLDWENRNPSPVTLPTPPYRLSTILRYRIGSPKFIPPGVSVYITPRSPTLMDATINGERRLTSATEAVFLIAVYPYEFRWQGMGHCLQRHHGGGRSRTRSTETGQGSMCLIFTGVRMVAAAAVSVGGVPAVDTDGN